MRVGVDVDLLQGPCGVPNEVLKGLIKRKHLLFTGYISQR